MASKWLTQGYGQPQTIRLLRVDIDPLAVGVTDFALGSTDWSPKAIEPLIRQLCCVDACLELKLERWSECQQGFDCIIGNPPWLFLSGRGSPVARLRRLGQVEEAECYQAWIDQVSQRFPDVSRGCKDVAKWFVGLALEQLCSDGQLALVLPEAFVRLARYSDVRHALTCRGAVRVWVNPVGTFSVTSVSCVIFLSGGTPKSVVEYRDLRKEHEPQMIKVSGFDWPVYRSEWAAECYTVLGLGWGLGDHQRGVHS